MLKILVAALAMMQPDDVAKDGVLCLENAGNGETMWVALAEKYLSGGRMVRQIVLKSGKKVCLRYDGVKSVIVTHYYRSEVTVKRGRIDPWNVRVCEKLIKNDAVFYRLGSNDDNLMTCVLDDSRGDSGIRALAAKAKPFQM